MLGPHDVGRRVVIRRIVGVRDNRTIFTDLLGQLVEYSEIDITVRTKAGAVRVPKSEIAKAKAVPDRRRPTATEALELAAAAGWPAGERDRLGDWWLRATDGWSMRGNSVVPIGDPGLSIGEAIGAVEAWYRARRLPPAISVPLPLLARLDGELERRGWFAAPMTLVMTAALDSIEVRAGEVRLDPKPSAEWLASVARRKGGLPASARRLLESVPQVRFASVYSASGALLATARGVVADDEGRWLGISLVETVPEARRGGLAQRMSAALAGWARPIGARDAYLQVEEHNAAAVALYTRLGFTVHHVYRPRILSA